MVEDPNDKCCKVPSCPGQIPTPAPNQTPRPVPGFSPTPGSGQPTLSPGLQTLAPPGQSTQTPQPGKEIQLNAGRYCTKLKGKNT